MSLLAKCPKCGSMIAKGVTCPNCFHGENASAPEQQSCVQEYQRRKDIHKRNYTIFMVAAMALGLTTLLLIGSIFMLTRGRAASPRLAAPRYPAPDMEQPSDQPPPLDDDYVPDLYPEDPELPPLNPDDFDYSPALIWMLVLLGLSITEGGLTFFVFKCRQWWPVELNCPGCEERLDELGGDPERCPACLARLR